MTPFKIGVMGAPVACAVAAFAAIGCGSSDTGVAPGEAGSPKAPTATAPVTVAALTATPMNSPTGVPSAPPPTIPPAAQPTSTPAPPIANTAAPPPPAPSPTIAAVLPEQHCLDDPINTTIRPILREGLSIVDACYSVTATVRSVFDERIPAGGAAGPDVYVHVLLALDDGTTVVAIVPPPYASNGGRIILLPKWGITEGDRVFATGALTYDANRAATVILPTWEIVAVP